MKETKKIQGSEIKANNQELCLNEKELAETGKTVNDSKGQTAFSFITAQLLIFLILFFDAYTNTRLTCCQQNQRQTNVVKTVRRRINFKAVFNDNCLVRILFSNGK